MLLKQNLISKNSDKWVLTLKGETAGGQIKFSEMYGDFIAWPENFKPLAIESSPTGEYLNATRIAETFGLSNQRVNNILSEMGWIERGIEGWLLTGLGNKAGGIQKEHSSGNTFTIWPESMLTDPVFLRSVNPANSCHNENPNGLVPDKDFPSEKPNQKYPDTLLKAKDGHMVRSRAELVIDNMLYDYGLSHAYERELPIAEKVISDFYIPSRSGSKAVYIEFWGINDNEKYLTRKKIKQKLYKREGFNLIQLEDKHIDNLDSHLPKMLLIFNINVE